MNLSQLHYFKKLAEVLHYTRAAQELFITQPTLSGAISSLENELEVSLFERSGRSVNLTPQGEIFYEHVCLALRAIDDGVAAVQDRGCSIVGSISLGTTFIVQDDYLPLLMRDYCAVCNNSVLTKIYQGFTNYLLDQLHKGTIDVAFCGRREGDPELGVLPGNVSQFEAVRARGPPACETRPCQLFRNREDEPVDLSSRCADRGDGQ